MPGGNVNSIAQLASVRTSLTLFAPAPSTISFVPLTRNLSPADPSPYSFEGTRYQKQASTVRNMRAVRKTASWGTRRIFRNTRCAKTGFYGTGEIFGTENALLRYGMNRIRLLRSGFRLEDAAITNNPTHPNPIKLTNHTKTALPHKLTKPAKATLLRQNHPAP